MKRCPACQRSYPDESLSFCRLDGTALVGIPSVFFDSETTVDLSATRRSLDTAPQSLQSIPSIAVLPFVHMSADPDDEYFCDGLAEELLNALARVGVEGRCPHVGFLIQRQERKHKRHRPRAEC